MLSFECIKNEKSVYFLLTSAGVITLYILGEVKILYWMNWIYVDTKNEMETNYEENF